MMTKEKQLTIVIKDKEITYLRDIMQAAREHFFWDSPVRDKICVEILLACEHSGAEPEILHPYVKKER